MAKKAKRLPLTLRAYRLVSATMTPMAGLLFAYRTRRGKEQPERISERRGQARVMRPDGALIWLHGASVGELLAIFPLVERLRTSGFRILVTSGTVTSANMARERLPADVIHQFIPVDAPRFVAEFLDHWQPDLALFAESDLWPNLIIASSARRIPMIIVNGRVSERSFRRWRSFHETAKALLGRFDLCLAQSGLDANRFTQLGAPQVQVTGNLKLDVPAPPIDSDKLNALKTAIGDRPVVAAASTHPGEDIAVIEAHRRLRNAFPNLLTIIAPRHPQRGRSIYDLAERAGQMPVLRSQRQLPDRHTQIYVADTMGELGLIYWLSPIVFVGGSLIEHGGQNPIEAIKLGAAVLHGPHVWNFADIYAALDAARAALEVTDPDSLTMAFGGWLRDANARRAAVEAGQKTVNRLGGALDRTATALEPYLMQLRIENRISNA
jgi:3-deoxy-D-manno-octulosonic-acid transferase